MANVNENPLSSQLYSTSSRDSTFWMRTAIWFRATRSI